MIIPSLSGGKEEEELDEVLFICLQKVTIKETRTQKRNSTGNFLKKSLKSSYSPVNLELISSQFLVILSLFLSNCQVIV